MYTLMQRSQYFVPRLKDPLVTLDWIDKVRRGVFWLPKTHELQFRICADIPSNAVIFDALTIVMANNGKDVGARSEYSL